ncbi:MAG TPA: serine/threonine protein phosphatase [Deltaproteobacteria bacterium]|nr:serine/threonine protein phosphatase [Deltaproteobacteria bacterium]
MGKIFVIGDIHGCLDKLKTMMNRLDLDGENDTLVFIGDYIDRGPDPKGVVDFILDLKTRLKHVVCLLGNHEQTFLNYYHHGTDAQLFYLNGGETTVESYGMVETPEGKKINVPEDHLEFFDSLLPYYETDDYIFVHAGIRPGVPMNKQNIEELTWIRYEFIRHTYDFGKIVIFGHTPLSEPMIEHNKIGIDTGAAYGGELTCVVLPDKEIIQV